MRSLMTTLIGLLRLNTRSKILEAGCGPGLTTKLLTNDMSSNSIAYCVDLSPKMLEKAKENFLNNDDFNSNQNNHWEVLGNGILNIILRNE